MLVYKSLRWNLDEDEAKLFERMQRNLSLDDSDISKCYIDKVSIDARKKNDVFQVADITFELVDKKLESNVLQSNKVFELKSEPDEIKSGDDKLEHRPIVIGSGPCGLFAAYELAVNGYRPIVIERGKPVDERDEDVRKLWEKGELNQESNVQFGEGGAGTFSDGKLTSRSKDLLGRKVLEVFGENGAKPEVLRNAKPHIGSDRLRVIVKNMREKIIALGGEFLFGAKLVDFDINNNSLKSIIIQNGDVKSEIPASVCVLAIGHSARDTYSMIAGKGLSIASKSFAVGVRIEHEQSYLNELQFGKFASHPKLGKAEYHLSHKAKDSRGIYTFCMCPGGYVIASSSEAGGVVTNGMSMSGRSAKNANSAIMVQVGPDDYGHGALDGVEFQRNLEQSAYKLGGGGFVAPAQTVGGFLAGDTGRAFGRIKPSYEPGVRNSNLQDILPSWCANGIAEGINAFAKKMRGFDNPSAILTGVETRSSAPLRILRGDNFQSDECVGLYPAGEGAGYSGGIVSSAIDGIKVARQIIAKFSPNINS